MGRTTLQYLFDSVIPQLKLGDEFILVGDGPLPDEATALIATYVTALPRLVRYIELPERVGDFGCTPCDAGIKAATGDAIFVIGDDDTIEPEAFATIKAALIKEPMVPHLFAMNHTTSVLKGTLQCGLVSSQQIVVPRDMTKMPLMADVKPEEWHVSDHVWMMKVHLAWNERTMFHDEIISTLTSQNRGAFL